MLKNTKYNLRREYKFYATVPPDQRSKGPVIAIMKEIVHKILNIIITLQVVALDVHPVRKRKRPICSRYLLPADQVTKEDGRDLMEQLPTSIILVSDFNSH